MLLGLLDSRDPEGYISGIEQLFKDPGIEDRYYGLMASTLDRSSIGIT